MNDRCSRLVYMLFPLKIFLALTMLAALGTANAQIIQRDQLVGTWRGSITTVYDGGKDETPISINFENNSTVTLRMLTLQSATYTVEGNTIHITFDADQNEPLTLTDVLLNKNSMVADGHFPSDHSSISNRLALSRVADDRRVAAPIPGRFCGNTDLSPNVQVLFNKYQVRCPINILENSRWYNFSFFKPFLLRLMQEVPIRSQEPASGAVRPAGSEEETTEPLFGATLSSEELSSWDRIQDKGLHGFIAYLHQYPNGQFANRTRTKLLSYISASTTARGIEISLFDKQSAKMIQQFINPILEDPNDLTYVVFQWGGPPGSHSFSIRDLKPSLRESPAMVNLNMVWAEIVNAAGPLGINLDSKTIAQKENTRSISQTVPRRISEPGGYIYFEYVTVTMESKTLNHVMVNLTSKIIKRKGYSSLLHSIDCNLDSRSDFCSEQPYMNAIVRALTGKY